MTSAVSEQIFLAVIDKLFLGLVTGIVLLIGQYYVSRSVERVRSSLAYRQALAESRITHLRDLWGAIHSYGVTVAGILRRELPLDNTQSLENINTIVKDFDVQLSKCGIFLGRERIESIKSRIGGAFLLNLASILSQEPRQASPVL